MIDDLRKVRAFFNEAEEVYMTLTEKLGHEPEAKNILMPLAYKHMVEYNREHQVIDPLLLGMAGKYLSIRYRALNKFFATPEAQLALEGINLEDVVQKELQAQR